MGEQLSDGGASRVRVGTRTMERVGSSRSPGRGGEGPGADARMEVRLLGPVELIAADGRPVAIGGPKERALLATLAVHANQAVSEDRLIDALWADTPPRTATRTVQSYLSRLRRTLHEADGGGTTAVLESGPGGWTLRLAGDVLDVSRVEAIVARARKAAASGDAVGAALAYSDALRAWRGRPLDEFGDEPWAVLEAARLEEFRHAVWEDRMDAELACGRHAQIVGELDAACRSAPLRERRWGQHMLALYRSGRQAEALRVFQDLRRTLAAELGLEPSPPLVQLEQAVLLQDPDLEWRPAATPATRPASAQGTAPAEPHRDAGIVTLLFTDIVASTELLGRLGDDEFDAVRRAHFRMLRDQVRAAGGTAVKNLGDGLMAVFASAVDAVACAVAAQQAVARHNRRTGERRFGVRIGLHAGEPMRDGDDYFGTPVVIAEGLCDGAAGGQIVASWLTAELVGSRRRFEFRDVGGVVVAGVAEPVESCTVVWTEEAPRPMPTALLALRERGFIGRSAELDELEVTWEKVQMGRRAVVLLAGEPGIGKTTLAVELATKAWSQGSIVLFGRCDEESVVPFQPFVEALAHYVQTTPPDVLRSQLGAQAADLALLVPDLGRRLDDVAGVVGTGAETERYRIFEAVPALIGAASADAPIVLVLDDLHWADRPTLQLLQHVIRATTEMPLLVVGTYRDTDLVRTHPMAETLVDLRRANLVTRLAVRGLSRDDVAAMVTGGEIAQPADNALADALWSETEGSPLFLREILRHLAETGSIEREETGRWRARRRIDQLGIPEGVKEVIGRRLTRLSDVANIALRSGSAEGREFRLDVLEAVTGLEADVLIDALDEATAAGVTDEVQGTAGRWAFTHALVREALYDELSITRRVRLHQRIGETLETLHGADLGPHLAELAYHFTQAAVGGGAERAIDYGRRAGEYALSLAAYEQAVRHFAAALEVAEDAGADVAVRADLLLAQGTAEWRAGDSHLARLTYERVVDLIGSSDPDRLARAALGYAGESVRLMWVDLGVVNERSVGLLEHALGVLPDADSALRARVTGSLARELYFQPGTDERRERLSLEAVAMARRLGDRSTLAAVINSWHLATLGPDNTAERATSASELMDLAVQLGDIHLVASGLFVRMISLYESGDLAATRRDLAQAETVVAQTKDPVNRQMLADMKACVAIVEGRFADAEAFLAEGFQLGQGARDRNSFAIFGAGTLWLRCLQGRADELLSLVPEMLPLYPAMSGMAAAMSAYAAASAGHLDEARAAVARVDPANPAELPRGFYWTSACSALAIACEQLEDADRCAVLYDLMLPYDGQTVSTLTLSTGPVSATLGRLAATCGRFDEAEAHFEDALHACAARGWRAVGAELQHRFAVMLVRRGRAEDTARIAALVNDAFATATELGMRGVAVDAATLASALADMGTAPHPGIENPVPAATRRDRLRARMTARGRAEVARWTRDHPDADLAARFGSQLAQRALFTAMAKSFQPAMAFGFAGDIVFELQPPTDDADPGATDWWTVEVAGRKATARRGRSDQAAVTVHLGIVDFVRVASGELHPVRLVVESRAQVEGEVMVAARLLDMFGAVESAVEAP